MRELLNSPLGDDLIDIGTYLLLGFLLWVGHKAIQIYERVSKTRASAEQRARVAEAIRRVASLANEKAHKYQKGLTATGPATSAEKMTVAKEAAKTWWPEVFDKMPEDKLEALIESELPLLRAPTLSLSPSGSLSMSPPSLPPTE